MRINRDTLRFVLVGCGAVPFFFSLDTGWARAALLAYLMTGLIGALLVGECPPFGTSWFWKTMIPVVVIHSAIVFGLVWLDLAIPEINRMPRVLYGWAVVILMIEWRLSLRIIDWCKPK